jgi:uncharacterized membrane protein YdjX (TVP38/TMEM64 family)
VQRHGSPAIFALAVIPNPFFDLGGIAAGVLRMPVWRCLAACWAGKVLRMIAVAAAGAGLFG